MIGVRGDGGLKLGGRRLGGSVRVVGIDVLPIAEGVVHGVFGHLRRRDGSCGVSVGVRNRSSIPAYGWFGRRDGWLVG